MAQRKLLIVCYKLFIICLLFMSLPIQAQWFPETLIDSPQLLAADSNKLMLSADVTGFFKNNEYFSPVAKGQTLPGILAIPALSYQVSDRFRAELGAYAIKYSGRDPLSNLQAFARLQYAITPNFHMVLGNLYGGVNHRLIEPLYQWEQHFINRSESGLQFLLHTQRWFADVWIDWQHFIQRGDSVPEVLNFGLSVSRLLTDPDSRFRVTLPVQLLIHHQGGQIDTSEDPMIVLGNIASGLCADLRLNTRLVQAIGLDVYVTGYYDRYSNDALRPYSKGWGLYPVLRADMSPFKIMAGYWHSDKFYAPQGELLFASFDIYNPQERLKVRDLVTFKLAFEKELFKGISIGAQLETYTDLERGETDYGFGVHLRMNRRFLLKSFND